VEKSSRKTQQQPKCDRLNGGNVPCIGGPDCEQSKGDDGAQLTGLDGNTKAQRAAGGLDDCATTRDGFEVEEQQRRMDTHSTDKSGGLRSARAGRGPISGGGCAQPPSQRTWEIFNRGIVYLTWPSSGGYLHLIWLPGPARELAQRDGALRPARRAHSTAVSTLRSIALARVAVAIAWC
jgi:hypothetical protein